MSQKLDSVSCGTDYTDAATVTDVYGCQGGYFSVAGNDAFIQVQYGEYGGGTQWSDEFHAPVGNGQLTAGTIGVRFRNYVAGSVAVVSAGLFFPKQPWFALSSSGNATPAASPVVTGTVSAAGAVVRGSGFSVNRTGTGVYVLTFSPAFSAAPTLTVTALTVGASGEGVTADVTITGGTATIYRFATAAGTAQNGAFSFIAETTV